MEQLTVDENELVKFIFPWLLSGRSLVSLPKFEKLPGGVKLSIVSIDNTKHVTLDKIFPNYGSVMGYYGYLVDRLSDF